MDHRDVVAEQLVERYLLDELSPSERDRFEAHLFSCQQCAEALQAASLILDTLPDLVREPVQSPSGASLAGTGLPGEDWRSRLRAFFAAPVFAPVAAALLGLLIYQNVFQIPRLRHDLAVLKSPAAVPAFVLLPVTRGDEQVLRLPHGSPVVVLNFDLTAPSPEGYLLEFAAGNGEPWLRLEEKPAPETESMTVRLEPERIPPGPQTLIVRSLQTRAELMRFRFVTEKQ